MFLYLYLIFSISLTLGSLRAMIRKQAGDSLGWTETDTLIVLLASIFIFIFWPLILVWIILHHFFAFVADRN